MISVTQMLVPINLYSRPGIKLRNVKGIVLHWTATPNAPAINVVRYFAGLAQTKKVYASAHFVVDESSIYQAIPSDEIAYHCGSKTYTEDALHRLGTYPNNCTLGIEMCVNAKGEIAEATFQRTADLVAELLQTYHLTVNDLWTHKGVVGWKDCPLPWVVRPTEFERFRKEVLSRMQGSVGKQQPVVQHTAKKEVSHVSQMDEKLKLSAIKAVDHLVEKGLINSPDYWKQKLEESMPVWAYMIIEARKNGLKV